MKFVEVIIPLSLPNAFTYSVPEEFADLVEIGKRVIVPFGPKKYYSGIIKSVSETAPSDNFEIKNIEEVLDIQPIINETHLKFWQWIADYYLCTIGDVMTAAIPSGLKLSSQSKLFFNADYIQEEELSQIEIDILEIISAQKNITILEINYPASKQKILKTVQSLVEKNAVFPEEIINLKYKPKTEQYVRLNENLSEEDVNIIFQQLEKTPKQLALLMRFVQLSGVFSVREEKEVSRAALCTDDSQKNHLKTLVKKGYLTIYQKQVSRLESIENQHQYTPILTDAQQTAEAEILNHWQEKQTVLLHGITSSGKTEIYCSIIEKCLQKGKQVLFIVPEIALTAQMITRLRAVFGNKVGIFHSKYTDAERVEVWQSVMKEDGYQIVLAVRAGIFLPFRDLGLIIVDEEHENSYKNFEAPRYQARDAAIYLAALSKAKVLLGTATPAIETYHNALNNKYGLVELKERYSGISMPEIKIADIALAQRQKAMNGNLHPDVIAAISETLQEGKQVLLFQNKRGFAPYLQCKICGEVPKCEFCEVSLTYHKHTNELRCHYCGFRRPLISQCPNCQSFEIEERSFGTEKIEEELTTLFPTAQIARLDADSSSSRKKYEGIINDFASGKLDILVGTQMISKGLDFKNVKLSVVLSADSLLNQIDFRASERAFQLMTQVSGRSGRSGERGIVYIQAAKVDNPVLDWVQTNNFSALYESEISNRKNFFYPPFYRLIKLVLRHKDKYLLDEAAVDLTHYLQTIFGKRVLGPTIPSISKINNLFIEEILLKIEKNADLRKAKSLVVESMNNLLSVQKFKSVRIYADVD